MAHASVVALMLGISSGGLLAQPLQITSPADGTVVRPGQNVTVSVAASGTFQQVIIAGEGPIGFSQPLTSAPYQFVVQIPSSISSRRYTLTADGATSPGQGVTSDPIRIDVERPDDPSNLVAEPAAMSLRFPGDQCPLRLVGTFSGGALADVTESTLVTYVSDAPAVATVSSSGMVTAVGAGIANINATYADGLNAFVQVTVLRPLSIVPPYAQLYPSGSRQFVAQVAGASGSGAVNWFVSPVGAGTVDANGVYSAPASIPAQQTVSITATSAADPAKTGTATVWLYPPVSVSVSPAAATLGASQVQLFAATITNALNTAAQWSIDAGGVGTIDRTGRYTAPASIVTSQAVTIRATSVKDPTKSGTASITLVPIPTLRQ